MSTEKASIARPPRRPRVAGFFYPAEAKKLRNDLDIFYAQAKPVDIPGVIFGIVAPHAGYVYSGQVAAEAYKQVQGRPYQFVIVIAPSHRDYLRGVSVYPGDYITPLGPVPVNADYCRKLTAASDRIILSELGHRDEHALEVQVPFLQTSLKDFQLIPLVMGSQDMDTCRVLGHAIANVFQNTSILVVASSDLSHFHPQSVAEHLDRVVADDFENFDEEKLYEHIMRQECEACGAGPMIAAMIATRQLGAEHARVLSYRTSGAVSGDYEQVVGYLAGILHA